ncbi:hypothetical protein AXW67_25910 [Bradyrhizobium neotropicale]|uniref:RHS repeat protein n=2 Tax=Bradyrhizobium neotropicale TaxID=1497615 RepID=A0A176YRG2_9BRAD|nr:hypothetical protein AXW67_25910 [Bradyrhizobium neotropicale]
MKAGLALAIPVLLLMPGSSLGAATVTYSYDLVGRVTSAAYDNGLCIIYAYDANGNRTAQSYSMSSAPTSQNWGSGVWGCYLKWTPQ